MEVDNQLELANSFAAVAETAADALCVLDLGDEDRPRIVYANPAFVRLSGHARDALAGLDANEALRLNGARWRVADLRAQFDRQPTLILQCGDGELRRMDADVIASGADMACLWLRPSDSDARSDDERRFRSLVEQSLQGLIVHRDDKPLFVNRAFLNIFGYDSVDEVLALPSIDVYVAPEDIDRTRRFRRTRLARGEAPDDYEIIGLRKDGRRIVVNCRPAVVDWDGAPAIQTVMFDVTARHQVEAAQRAAIAEAQRGTRMKSEFLSMVSHEIRTPMNSIIGMSDLLLGADLDPRSAEYAGIIRESANGLMDIVNDLLDLSRLEAGRMTVEEGPFDPRDVATGVAAMLRHAAEAKGIALDVALDADLPLMLVGDSGHLRQVLINLVGNAVKFTAEGRVTVRLASEAGDGGAVMLRGEVRDTGIGIDPGAQEALFQPFAQADRSINRRYGGSGLGLAICRHLCTLMDGEIGVESEPGVGSRFWFRISCGLAEKLHEPLIAGEVG